MNIKVSLTLPLFFLLFFSNIVYAANPTLSANPAAVNAGGTTTVSWNNIATPMPMDWIGLFASGAADTAYSKWIYVSCSQTPTNAQAAGSCAFTIPPATAPGQYEFRLFANNGSTKLATSTPITVATPPMLSASPVSLSPGGTSTVSWSNITNPTARDWIGLFASGAADTNYSKWIYVSCSQTESSPQAAGSCAFTIPPATPSGQYEFRLFANNGSLKLATSALFTVTATLSSSPAIISAGGTSTVSWSNIGSPTARDWIGFFASGAADTNYNPKWIYVSCSQTSTDAQAAGSCAYTIPPATPPGQYEFRLFANNGSTKLATSAPITVAVPPTFSAAPAIVNAGAVSTVSWSNITNASPTDWIGLFASGAVDTNYPKWIYVSCSQTSTTAQAAGSCAVTIPPATAPGQYEFRLFSNNGSLKLATSTPITVTSAILSASPANINAGDVSTVSWSNIASPSPTDWIGLFVSGAADANFADWIYVSCAKNAGSAKAAGSCAFTVPPATPSGQYEFRLFTNNGYSKLAASAPITVTLPSPTDNQAPSVPAGLTTSVVSTTQVNLSWSASTDNVGVTGYKIYRNGSFLQITASTNYSDTGLINNTTYSYQVSAVDAANNESACTAVAFVTTFDPTGYTPIVYGQTMVGTISTPASINKYSFTAQAGDKVVIPFAETIGDGFFETRVRIFDSSGTMVADANAISSGVLGYTISIAGTYFIWISDQGVDRAGSYEFTLQRSNNPANVTAINMGDTKSDSITKTGIMAYSFTAQAGDKVVIPFAETIGDGFFETRVRIFDSSGTMVADANAISSGVLTYTTPTAGTYFIWISDQGVDRWGSYEFTLQRSNNPANVTAINMGDTKSDSITKTGIMAYSFTAQAGDKVVIPFAETIGDGFFETRVRIFDSSGTMVADANAISSGVLTYTTPTAGTYFIWISDQGVDRWGSFQFSLIVDITPPTASITAPSNIATLFGNVTISGTASDANFVSYQLEYGIGNAPLSWILIKSSTTPVTSSTLGTWDTTLVPNNTYTLRLTATDIVGSTSSASITIIVDNISITNVSASPIFINPAQGQTAAISFTLDRPANVTVEVYNVGVTIGGYGDGTFYRQYQFILINNAPKPAGINTIPWNGKNNLGQVMPASAYGYVIKATSGPQTKTYDPPYISGGGSITNQGVSAPTINAFKNETVQLNYSLTVPAWVTIGGEYPAPLGGFIIQAQPRPAGPNSEIWDGRDGNGNIYQDGAALPVSMKTEIMPSLVTVLTGGTTAQVITDLSTDPYLMFPIYREFTTIRYTITRTADFVLSVVDPAGSSWILSQGNDQAAGTYSFEWKGQATNGGYVRTPGNYRIDLVVTDKATNATFQRSANVSIY